MEREILYKALNADNKWIYGLPYADGINDTRYFEEYSNRMCWRDSDSGAHCNQPYKNGTLCQFTGLTDKHGRKIFEGDKFYDDDEDLCTITWDDCYLQWYADYSDENGLPLHRYSESEIEIIGNIHNNSSLV